ncbi:MAG: hypothetical protein H0W83_14345 [Planctomycetes bacterium]|nr:hypothetical protein [Planctomycetota bacterium]
MPPRLRRSVTGNDAATPPIALPASPPGAAPGAADPGEAVNPLSRAVNPRAQYPLHFDLLMRDFFAHGIEPERLQVVAADEVRLDENGMDVEFTLMEVGTEHMRRCRVDVNHGRLVQIQHY